MALWVTFGLRAGPLCGRWAAFVLTELHRAASENSLFVWDCSGPAAGISEPQVHQRGSRHAL